MGIVVAAVVVGNWFLLIGLGGPLMMLLLGVPPFPEVLGRTG